MENKSAGKMLKTISDRLEFMRVLIEEPKTKPEMVERLSVSRSTVDRAIGDLVEAGLVTRSNEGFEATLLGRLATRRYISLEKFLSGLADARELLEILPEEGGADSIGEVLEDGEIIFSDTLGPQIFEFLVSTAKSIRVLTPIIPFKQGLIFYEEMVEENLDVEVIFEKRTIDQLRSFYPKGIDRILSRENIDMYVTDKVLPFGLALIREDVERVYIVVYDSSNDIIGIVRNNSDKSVKWGKETYDRYREKSEKLEPRSEE